MNRGMMDLIVIGSVALSLAVILLISNYAYNTYSDSLFDSLENSSLNYTIANARVVDTAAKNVYSAYDKIFLVFMVFLLIISLWGAYNINTHPIFFIASVFSFIIALLLLWVFQYAFATITSISLFNTTTNQMPIINYFMNNLPLIGAMYFLLLTIVTYTTRRGDNGGIVSAY